MGLEHRPTFALEVASPLERVQSRLRSDLTAPWLEVRWARTPAMPDQGQPTNHLILVHQPELRSFWSPWLTLDLHAVSDAQTRVAGRFSPHPSLWIGFMFAYLGLAALSLFALLFAFSQWSLGKPPVALWALCGTGALTVGLWAAGKLGERRARTQMEELRQVLEGAVRESP